MRVSDEETTARRSRRALRRASTGSLHNSSSSPIEEDPAAGFLLKNGRSQSCKKDILSISLPGATLPPYQPLKSCLSTSNLHDLTSTHAAPATTIGKRTVSFHRIEFREHQRALGDHPDVSAGPALSLDWESAPAGSFAVEDYEKHRPPRRGKSELAVPRAVREHMLRQQAGVSRSEMAAANRATERIKQGRRHTASHPHMHGVHPVKAFKKLLGKGHNTEKEVEALMAQSQRAERIREQQRQAYLEQLMHQMQVDNAKKQEQEKEQQLAGQSTKEESEKSSHSAAHSAEGKPRSSGEQTTSQPLSNDSSLHHSDDLNCSSEEWEF